MFHFNLRAKTTWQNLIWADIIQSRRYSASSRDASRTPLAAMLKTFSDLVRMWITAAPLPLSSQPGTTLRGVLHLPLPEWHRWCVHYTTWQLHYTWTQLSCVSSPHITRVVGRMLLFQLHEQTVWMWRIFVSTMATPVHLQPRCLRLLLSVFRAAKGNYWTLKWQL